MITPYPSLATLPEVIAAGGVIPRRFVSASTRVVFASTIADVVLDCVLDTGRTASGGAPTDNAARINQVLATATASSPIRLVMDGATAIGSPILIPPAGHVEIEGLGWDTGFFVLSGSSCNAIQNVPDTDLDVFHAWVPGQAGAIVGYNVALRDFRVVGNRGTFPNGNVPAGGNRDGSIPNPTSGVDFSLIDARSPYAAGGYWLSGIMLRGVEGLVIDRVWVYDAPTYHIDIYHSRKVWIGRCRLEALALTLGANTDGIHVNAGCSDVWIDQCWISAGDDSVAFNLDEGEASQAGADLTVTDCRFFNSVAGVRTFGNNTETRRVSVRNLRCSGIQQHAFTVGAGGQTAGGVPDCNHTIDIDGVYLESIPAGADAVAWIANSSGTIKLRNVHLDSPSQPIPIVLLDGNCRVSSLEIRASIHRSTYGSAAAYCLQGGDFGAGCEIGALSVEMRVTEELGQAPSDIPALIDLAGTTVGRTTLDVDAAGVGTVFHVPSSGVSGTVLIKSLVHASNGGSATSVVNDSAAPFHLHTISALGYGVSALSGGSGGTITSTGAALVAF